MPIEGILAYAKCSQCGTVLWTEDRSANVNEADQAVICKCGLTGIANSNVIGAEDGSFEAASLQDLLNAEAAE